ncbi:MAG: sialidase family protein, partial [Thermoanaerobaculia bacterium]
MPWLSRIACAAGWVFLAVFVAHAAPAQKIEVGKTVTISADVPADPHGESFLAVNPKNGKNMLAVSCRISRGEMGTSGYVSHDGGVRWTRVVLPESAAKVSTGWDAIAYFDAGGNAFYGANDGDGLYITRSSDEGRTWSAATLIAGAEGFDRQYMGFDRTGRFAGRIYAGASVMSIGLDGKERSALAVAFSTDAGKTFGQPSLITSTPDERVFTFVNMIVTPDGTVLLPFLTMPERVMPETTLWDPHDEIQKLPEFEMSLRVATSGDGGRSFSISPRMARYRLSGDRTRAARAQGNGNTA